MNKENFDKQGRDVSGLRVFLHSAICLALLLGGTISLLHGQGVTTSSVSGFVTDSSRAAIPQARVTIKDVATGYTRTVLTETSGEYSVTLIPAGNYTLTIEKTGFKTAVKTNQVITQQLPARVDFVLEVRSVKQTVNVRAAAPIVNTETPSEATTIGEQKLTQLPTLGNDILQEAILAPGVVPMASDAILPIVEGNYFSGGVAYKPVGVDVSGGPPEFTGYVQDGFDVRDPIYGGDLYQPSPGGDIELSGCQWV